MSCTLGLFSTEGSQPLISFTLRECNVLPTMFSYLARLKESSSKPLLSVGANTWMIKYIVIINILFLN